MNFRKLVILIFGTLFMFSTLVLASVGGNGSGGDNPRKLMESLVTFYINGGAIKYGLLNYLKGINYSPISTNKNKQRLSDPRLKTDILTPKNYEIKDSCVSETDKDSLTSADIGDFGGPICFNVTGLSLQYLERGLSPDEVLIELAAHAIHEHFHHLQKNNPEDNNKANELEAGNLGADFLSEARTGEAPTLIWVVKPRKEGTFQLECTNYPGGYDKETIIFTLDQNNKPVGLTYESYDGEIHEFVKTSRGTFEYTEKKLLLNLIISLSADSKVAHLMMVYKDSGVSHHASFFNCE